MPWLEGMWVLVGAESRAAHSFFCPKPTSDQTQRTGSPYTWLASVLRWGLWQHRDWGWNGENENRQANDATR
jgi:hypothetical protein